MVSLVDLPDLARPWSDACSLSARETRPSPVRRTTDAPATRWSSAETTGPAIAERRSGDPGARDYLATHDAALVECGDLATGPDVDARSSAVS